MRGYLRGINPTVASDPVEDAAGSPGDGNTPHDWSEEAFRWAVENGVLKGSSANKADFRLNDPMTREEMLVFLHRAINSQEK